MNKIQPAEYIDGVLAGNRRLIAKTITLVESALPEHRALAGRVLEGLLPHTGGSVRIGITGVPGVGKSVFIEAFGTFLTGQGQTVAVLAVDPSSSRSGGSVLGDKTRMEKLSANPRAYIRPSPSGKTLGGIAAKTREDILVCEAAGFDVVIVETVGVGQSETAVADMVDFFLVLMLAGAGDELQGIKKGILELADAVAITKADGDNIGRAEQAAKAYETALHLLAPPASAWHPPVLTCSAFTGAGIDRIWRTIEEHQEMTRRTGEFQEKRAGQNTRWMWNLIEEGIKTHFLGLPEVKGLLPKITRQVAAGETTAARGAAQLLFCLDKQIKI
jgi:LAO/AO transport system kinase